MNKKTLIITILALFVSTISLTYPVHGSNFKLIPLPFTTWTDDFSSTTLNSQWHWIRQNPTHWSLTTNPGYMQITTDATHITNTNVTNLLVQPAPVGSYSIETKLGFTPTQNYQIAGLLIYQDDNNWMQLGRAFCNNSSGCVGDGVYFDSVINGNLDGSNFATVLNPLPTNVYLKIARQGTQYSGYLSLDGTNWGLIGNHAIPSTPTFIGLKVSNQALGDAEIPANYDYFTLLDSSLHLYLPLVTR
jgi:beta-xylosidase